MRAGWSTRPSLEAGRGFYGRAAKQHRGLLVTGCPGPGRQGVCPWSTRPSRSRYHGLETEIHAHETHEIVHEIEAGRGFHGRAATQRHGLSI
jgi:hypothetical protein